MQTIYIDVYFLINFCVDALAMYFAIRVTKSQGTILRLIITSVGLSLGACLYTVFFHGQWLGAAILFLTFFLSVLISVKQMNTRRFFKVSLWFLLFAFLIGGVVHYSYGILEEIVKNTDININNGAESRKYLLFSVFVLAAIGFVRLFILSYESTKHADSVTLCFTLFERNYELCALVDSGNLLCDPLTRTPVVVVKSSSLRLPFLLDDSEIDSLDYKYKKQLRLIPTKSLGYEKLLYGFYIDRLTLCFGKKRREASLTIAIDQEGGTYGGYLALAPSRITEYDT